MMNRSLSLKLFELIAVVGLIKSQERSTRIAALGALQRTFPGEPNLSRPWPLRSMPPSLPFVAPLLYFAKYLRSLKRDSTVRESVSYSREQKSGRREERSWVLRGLTVKTKFPF